MTYSATPDYRPDTDTPTRFTSFAIASIVLGVVGWFASLQLAVEYLRVLQNPEYTPGCDISPLVTCGPNMDSWQGSLFGFSNTFIGIAAFTAPIIVGVALLAGARFRAWFWWLYILGNFAGVVFIFWLSWQSVFRLGTLCPWCMVVWIVMIPLFWITLLKVPAAGVAGLSEKTREVFKSLHQWTWVFIVFSYLFIAVEAQIGVDWLTHVRLMFL